MTCISLDLVFLFSNIYDVSMPLIHTYLKLHSKPFSDRVTKGKSCNGTIQIIRAKVQKQSPKWSNCHTWDNITLVV
jgi:hypothetical protein